MDIVIGLVGFVLLMAALSWYQTKKQNEKRRKEELYTMTVKELIKGLKKCDPDREVIIADLRYANYDISASNLLGDIVDPEK
jgi:type II secretory pathway pseudopilin PulG